MPDQRYIYTGPRFENVSIEPVPYIPDFFDREIALESEVFYELRKQNDIRPYRLSESTPEELEEIAAFFENNRDSFFFLFEDAELTGSVLSVGNYIQCLSVATAFQRRGIGSELTKYAINRILDTGHATVELNIMPGNDAAHALYRKLGFIAVDSQ